MGAVDSVVAVTKAGMLLSEDTKAESSVGQLTPPGLFRLFIHIAREWEQEEIMVLTFDIDPDYQEELELLLHN